MAMNIMNEKQRGRQGRENLGNEQKIYSKVRMRDRFVLLFDILVCDDLMCLILPGPT